MLIQLLRRVLGPYKRQMTIVTVLLLIRSIANLYLPNLNADIAGASTTTSTRASSSSRSAQKRSPEPPGAPNLQVPLT